MNVNLNKSADVLVKVVIAFTLLIGAVMVVIPVRPFWVDEWFIIYNLKTKDAHALWGPLALMQQFPRAYIQLVKLVTSAFNYSYQALRLPSLVTGSLVILLGYKTMNRLYDKSRVERYIFLLVLIASATFTEYFVQVKQYTMDMLMSVVAIWQLYELLQLRQRWGVYVVLCLSCFICPFFSYTYLIVALPVFGTVMLRQLLMDKVALPLREKARQWLPMVFALAGGVVFYFIDGKQLMADSPMHGFWSFLMVDTAHPLRSLMVNGYAVFAQVGAGDLFGNLFGVLGVVAFVAACFQVVRRMKSIVATLEGSMVVYSCGVLFGAFVLFLAGKLPLGTPRLNAFTLPSIAILLIWLLQQMEGFKKWVKPKIVLTSILFLWLFGNVFVQYFSYFLRPEYKLQMAIYTATNKVLNDAKEQHLPVMITRHVCYPYEVPANPDGAPEPGVWMVKAFPGYDIHNTIQLYPISDTSTANLPNGVQKAFVGDGLVFRMVGM